MWLRYFRSLTFLLALACLIPFAFAADPDFSTNESRLAFVEALLEKYPNIVRANLQYRRNLMQVLKQFHELTGKLGPNLTSLSNRTLSTMEMSYAPGQEVVPNESAIKLLKAGFQSDLEKLPMTELKGLKEDLQSQVNLSTFEGKLDVDLYKKNVSRLVRQAPLLYGSNGKPISGGSKWQAEAKLRLEGASIFDLENLYSDMFLQHQLPLLEAAVKTEKKSALLNQVVKTQVNNLKKDISTAARPVMKNGEDGIVRNLRVEEVLSPVDIFRGCFGKDCSILSVPYFPAVKGTKTYFVHKSKVPGSPPDGYVFVAPVKVGGKTLPYVITTNGNLIAEDVQKAVQAVALDWGVDEYVRANFTNSPYVVNSDAMREGLRAPGGKAVQVELPPGWEEVSKFIKANGVGYSNYYAAENLQNAFVAKVNVETPDLLAPIKRTLTESKPLQATGKISARPALDRALLAVGAVDGDKSFELREFVMKRLSVTASQMAAAEKLQGTEFAMGRDLFATLEKEFGFRFKDIETLDLAKWMNSLNLLHKEAPFIATEAEWSKSYERVWADIKKEWGHTVDQERVRLLNAIHSFIIEVPAPHRQTGKIFIDSVVDWMVNAGRFPHSNFLELLEQGYIDSETFNKVFPKIVDSVRIMAQDSRERFTKALGEHTSSWSQAEKKAAWKNWYKAVDSIQMGMSSKILYAVPEEFRDVEWLEAIWNHAGFGYGSNAYLQLKRELPSNPRLTVTEQEAMARLEKKILAIADSYINMTKPLSSPFELIALFEVLQQPEYNAHFVELYGGEGLKNNIFKLVKADSHSSWPRFEKFQYLQKWGMLEEFLNKEGLSGDWSRGASEFNFAKGLARMLKDPQVPDSTKSALHREISKHAKQRFEYFISKPRYDSSSYFFQIEELNNPYLLDLLGSDQYEKLTEQLRREFLEYRSQIRTGDRKELERVLRTLVSNGPAEAAVPIFAMLDETGRLPASDELHAQFAARMKKDPAMALHYQRIIQPGFTKNFSRGLDSCRRFFAGFKNE